MTVMPQTPERRRELYRTDPEYRAKARAAVKKAQQAQRERDLEGVREYHRVKSAEYRERVRAKIFDHYGWTCACCGSTDRITLDHINEDGREHRQRLGTGVSTTVYEDVIRQGLPDTFQTLCHPCNFQKYVGGGTCRLHGVALTGRN
jgi:hypothetical protein